MDYFNIIIVYIYSTVTQNILLLILSVSFLGFTTFLSHGYKNTYLLKQNMIALSILLPPIALIITKAISSNLFLSLGMIGALSIIRYRTPVKSGYELSLLFGLITIGVVGGVDFKLSVILTIFIIVVPFLLDLGKKVFPKILLDENSVVSGVQIIITTRNKEINIEILNNFKNNLKTYSQNKLNNDKFINYTFSFENMEQALIFRELINKTKISYDIKIIST